MRLGTPLLFSALAAGSAALPHHNSSQGALAPVANASASGAAPAYRRQTPQEIIEKYSGAVEEIVRYITVDNAGRAFDKLANFCDKWGHRLQGSDVMEESIDDHERVLQEEGFVTAKEPCNTCPHWERGEESAELIAPLIGGRAHPMKMMGLGRSVGTPPEGIEAPVLVVRDFEALEDVCEQAQGKIVVWNLGGWFGYGENNQYRTGGAVAAARCGAVASLTRSVTPFSLDSPHTGSMSYEEGVPEIPAAAITIEDTELLQRMQARGSAPIVRLTMAAQNFADRLSYNLIADLPGAEIPDEIVFMSGHMDSWDFGSGAMDDGQGWATGWTAMEAIAQLTQASGGGEAPAPVLPAPKRTLRTIHWAAEEWGSQGAADYWSSGVQDSTKISLGMGDDNGAFTPTSFAFTGSDDARAIIEAIVFMLRENGIDVDVTEGGGFEGSGQVPDVPRGTVDNNGGNPDWAESGDAFRGNYFFFHHTAADTMTTLDKVDMDLNTAMYAAIAYVVADLEELLPRDDDTAYCTGAHFPEGVHVPRCNCTTVNPKAHRNVSRVSPGLRPDLSPCITGWPNEEYYTPHSGKDVPDGHWANARPMQIGKSKREL
jgi:carboxypeptidase Q